MGTTKINTLGAINALGAREIKDGVKKGLGIEFFCAKYNCTKEQLERQISILFSRNQRITQKVMSDLKTNDKKKSSKKRTRQPSENMEDAKEQETTEEIEEIDQDRDLDVMANEELYSLERILSDEIIGLESDHKALFQKHMEGLKKLRQLRKDLEEIRRKLNKFHQDYEDLASECNNLAAQMNQISAHRRVKVSEIEEVRAKIAEREKIVICVYLDGSIKLFDDDTMDGLDESGNEELCNSLIEKEACQDLRLKDIKILARVISIVKNSSRKIEMLFENDEIERCFQAIID